MNNFKKVNEIVRKNRAELNSLYKNMDNEFVLKGLEILNLKPTKSSKLAILRRIVDLKVDPLENELKKLKKDENELKNARNLMYEYVCKIYENRHAKLIKTLENECVLDEFYMAVIKLMHSVGIKINAWQKVWQEYIIDGINKEFETKFKNLNEATKFCDKFELYQKENGVKADRSYGAVIKDADKYRFVPYAVVFENEVKAVANELEKGINAILNLAKTDMQKAYINYFKKLKLAFLERENDNVIKAWQEAEIAWMQVRGEIQPAHPLEYYEDAYTHAVALEWDIRLVDDSGVDESSFKNSIKDSFLRLYDELNFKDESLKNQVLSNVELTQLYVSVPLIYYGAELNGLFSAQVVPNDELVSKMCGKKIFAFVNYVYESAKAKPFMKLSSEIFSKEFLNFSREILYTKPEIWKKVYEISTIGHEFGHILFIDTDTEQTMNTSGEFKFIEEYKATTGGLVNFFYHEDERYKMAVFHELITRAVGLIGWMKVDEVRAYYCEGLIHLSLLFKAGVLNFKDEKLSVNFNDKSYENFKNICLENYKILAKHYANKQNSSEFLAKFCESYENTFLPKDEKTKHFVLYFYERYKAIGNDIDDSGEWESWQSKVI